MQNLQTAQRKRAKIKMGLQGPSGSGKTYSALLVAYGICMEWNKIALVDSENHSGELYAHLGEYNVLSISSPFTPEKYIEAISICESAGMEVIIIDSCSMEWEYLLEYHSSLQGNSFTNWAKITPRHNSFVQKILQSPCHTISTIRTKQDYVLNEKNGKMVPEKVGLKSVQRDGLEYEFTLVFDLDMKNHATASKDRTGLFFGKPEQKLKIETGKIIQAWCNLGSETSSMENEIDVNTEEIIKRVDACKTVNELLALYKQFPKYQESLLHQFTDKRQSLAGNKIINNQNLINNGTSNNK
jgi:hypothetical protein